MPGDDETFMIRRIFLWKVSYTTCVLQLDHAPKLDSNPLDSRLRKVHGPAESGGVCDSVSHAGLHVFLSCCSGVI